MLDIVAVIFGSGGDEFCDGVATTEVVGHIFKVITKRDVRFIRFTRVDDGVCIEVEVSLLELLQLTVQLEPGVAGGESGHENVDFTIVG